MKTQAELLKFINHFLPLINDIIVTISVKDRNKYLIPELVEEMRQDCIVRIVELFDKMDFTKDTPQIHTFIKRALLQQCWKIFQKEIEHHSLQRIDLPDDELGEFELMPIIEAYIDLTSVDNSLKSAICMYMEGNSFQDIANTYGVSKQYIHNLFKKLALYWDKPNMMFKMVKAFEQLEKKRKEL